MLRQIKQINKHTMNNRIKWSLDKAHSEISFKIRHLMIAHVTGTFTNFETSVYTQGNDFLTAEINLWIDANSLTTGDAKRDEHLKDADFFDLLNHKQIAFVSNSIALFDRNGNYDVW